VLFILVTTLLDSMGVGLVMPVLPSLLQSLAGGGVADVGYTYGLLVAAYPAAQFLCAPVLGKLSDRFGRRPVLLFAMAGAAANYVVAASTHSVAVLFVAQALSGACGASIATAAAYAADVTPPDRRAQSFGMIWATFGAGIIVGPVIGGVLSGIGPRAPFWAAAALVGCNFLYGLLVLPESLPRGARRAFQVKGLSPFSFVTRLRRSGYSGSLVAGLALSIGALTIAQPATMLFPQLRLGWTVRHIGFYLTAAGIVVVLGQLALMRALVPRLGERRLLLAALLVRSIGWFLIGFAARDWHMYAALLFFAIGSVVQPLIATLMSRGVSREEQGELQGALTSVGVVAETLGPLAGASVFGYFTAADAPLFFPGAAFMLSGCVGAAALACLAFALAPRTIDDRRPAVAGGPAAGARATV